MDLTKNNNDSNQEELHSNAWQRLSEWIHCICVVTFDLELGQAMEAIYPSSIELSEKEKLNICYLAFPDSNSGCIGDTQFHIRLRVAPATKKTLLNPELQRFSLQCVTTQRPDLGHYWGFVYFRQMKDTSLPRGYFQKSVILLSRLPFINLFYEVLGKIAPRYFAGGESVLQNACLDISNWPPLQAGENIQLPMLGTIFQTYIPSLTSANLQQSHAAPIPPSTATLSHIEDLQNESKNETFTPTSVSNDTARTNATAATTTTTTMGSSNDTSSERSEDNDDACSKNNHNINNESNDTRPQTIPSNSGGETVPSREDILDRYKQSKDQLLAHYIKTQADMPCDKISSKSLTGANNANDYENTDNDGGNEADLDDYLNGSYSDSCTNTQSECSTNIDRPLRIVQQNSPAKTPIVLLSATEIDIFRSLYTVLSYTHLLWELVLTAEPIVVMATSPSDCSHMVQSLMSMIAPLPYAAEARPYFTIHDSEFKEFTQCQQGPVPIILGVTNPFFSKTLQHWPHLIRMADNNNGSNLGVNATTTTNPSTSSMLTQQGLRKLKIFTKILDIPQGVYTQYKPFLQKDKTIIRNLLAGVKKQRPPQVQTAFLRRHLLELTQSFMIPLERYMASLMPLQKDISAFRAAPAPNPFKQDCFLAKLEQSGPQLTSPLKGDWSGLYKRFFRSRNFLDWYELRYRELTQTLQHLQMQALSNTNLKQWVIGKHEVEIVDMILKVKQKLKICNEISLDGLPQVVIAQNETTRKQLYRHLEDMKRFLPDDMNKILSSRNDI